jgi:pyruvate dehydrogenase complex dehydrogenase (E1) component
MNPEARCNIHAAHLRAKFKSHSPVVQALVERISDSELIALAGRHGLTLREAADAARESEHSKGTTIK